MDCSAAKGVPVPAFLWIRKEQSDFRSSVGRMPSDHKPKALRMLTWLLRCWVDAWPTRATDVHVPCSSVIGLGPVQPSTGPFRHSTSNFPSCEGVD